MYQLGAPEPFWLEFWTGVRVKFRPIGFSASRSSRRVAYKLLSAVDEEVRQAEELMEQAGGDMSAELIRRGIVDWEGLGDPGGDPLPVTPETIEWFISDAVLFERADDLYVAPYLARDREKNVSALLPSGNLAGAIAGDPSAKTALRSAKSVLMKSMPSKPKVAKSRGTSSKPRVAKSAPGSAAPTVSTSKRS